MPKNYQQFGQEWLDLNPGYTLHDWTEEEIFDTEWINQEVIDQMKREASNSGADKVAFYTHVADVVDYELMLQGGWYFNTDLKPLRPLSHVDHDIGTAGLAMEDDQWPVNMAMYAPRDNHGFYRAVVEQLGPRYFNNPGAYMNYSTGCHLLKSVMDQGWAEIVETYPRTVFNPIHWADFDYGSEPDYDSIEYPAEAVATHLWGHRTNQRGQRILETW